MHIVIHKYLNDTTCGSLGLLLIIPLPLLSLMPTKEGAFSTFTHLLHNLNQMTSWQDLRYLDNHRSDHQVSHIKLNCQMSTKRHNQQYVNIFDGAEMTRQKRVKYVKNM